jgi:hypothetical protein
MNGYVNTNKKKGNIMRKTYKLSQLTRADINGKEIQVTRAVTMSMNKVHDPSSKRYNPDWSAGEGARVRRLKKVYITLRQKGIITDDIISMVSEGGAIGIIGMQKCGDSFIPAEDRIDIYSLTLSKDGSLFYLKDFLTFDEALTVLYPLAVMYNLDIVLEDEDLRADEVEEE